MPHDLGRWKWWWKAQTKGLGSPFAGLHLPHTLSSTPTAIHPIDTGRIHHTRSPQFLVANQSP